MDQPFSPDSSNPAGLGHTSGWASSDISERKMIKPNPVMKWIREWEFERRESNAIIATTDAFPFPSPPFRLIIV